MILDLDEKLVEKTANYVQSFFPYYYGSIAATLLEKNPFKYRTKVIYNDEIKGVLSYDLKSFNNGKSNRAKIRLLAGDDESIEKLISPLKNSDLIFIKVPSNFINYIENLKKIGFREYEKIYSKDLGEEMIVLSIP
ncbi:MAG: hypothetical protein PHN56_00045 [Candidatus Nanoarchaeia archaeon]|nr:hypothetical protein [Candidatus Nanoarchaeia archaeon]